MPLRPWRFQADITPGEVDPVVTMFVGPERYMMDDNGDPTDVVYVEQATADPVMMKLSEVPAVLASGTVVRTSKSKP
jgi:hypothetical protein